MIAWIVAVNLVIYLGVEGGYQAGLGDVFGLSVVLGIVVVGVVVAGPARGDLAALEVVEGEFHGG